MTDSTRNVGFLAGDGEMAARIIAHDWSESLGPLEDWPQSLKTTVGLLVRSPVPIVLLWGPDGIMIYNDAYSIFAGGRHPQLLGSKVREGWPEVADFNDNVMKVGLAGGTLSYKDQELTLHRTGKAERVWMNLDYSPVIDESGKPGGVIAIVVETSERVLAERRRIAEQGRQQPAQRESEAQLRELNADLERKVIERAQARGLTWQVTPDLMGALNSQGYFETSNPAWQSILGWSEAEVAAMSIFEMLHPDDVERTRAGFEMTQRGQPAIRFPNRYRCKDGSYRWISWVGVPEDGMVYCTGRDITEEKAAEAQLVLAQDALRQSQKMEAVGQLTGGIAHDFNNLLQGITGSLDRVMRRLAEGRINDLDRFLKAAIESANRAAALTHRLLAFSRRQTLDAKPTDVNRLIGGMEDLIRRTMGPEVNVEVIGAVSLWPIHVDGSQLENSLLNLCINARDAMPGGGNLTIETANKWIDDHAAKTHEVPAGQYVSLCVTDTGSGMTQEVIDRAFDPFFTTKPLGQGTGLGLSMIYGFVRQSGGQVRIYSEIGEGTTMCLYFPRYFGEAQKASATPSIDAVEPGAGEVVLIVDDEGTVRMLVAEVLAEADYKTLEAHDGPAALKILQSDARIDLLITDVGLPGGMNGRQVADAARVTRPDLKVIFITGFAENAVIGSGRLDRGMEILAKPFTMATLGNKVREMLET
ncbi:MAG TPA: PAS domain S-box protein [Rhizomicrobium sp.]